MTSSSSVLIYRMMGGVWGMRWIHWSWSDAHRLPVTWHPGGNMELEKKWVLEIYTPK